MRHCHFYSVGPLPNTFFALQELDDKHFVPLKRKDEVVNSSRSISNNCRLDIKDGHTEEVAGGDSQVGPDDECEQECIGGERNENEVSPNSFQREEANLDSDVDRITLTASLTPESAREIINTPNVQREFTSLDSLNESLNSNSSLMIAFKSPSVRSVDGMIEDRLEANQGYIYLSRSVACSCLANTGSTGMSENFELTDTVYEIPNQCAICLCDYKKGDTIVTSCDRKCPHAFHQDCIIEWLVKMQEGTPCPCCRRTFVRLDTNPRTLASGSYNNNANDASQHDPDESHRRRRRSFGVQQRSNNNSSHNALHEGTQEVERLRQEWIRHMIDEELRRRRAFNASVISLR